jgi:hypothetical protein
MRIKKLFITSGALILGIAAVFATKRPSSTLTTVYYTVAGGCNSLSISAVSPFTTGGIGLTQAKIRTSGNTLRSLWGSCSSGIVGNAVHFNP